MNRLLACILPVALLGAGCADAVDTCRYTADRAVDASLDGIVRVVVHAGPGNLSIQGDPQRGDLRARGLACAPRRSALENVQIRSRQEGDTLYVITEPGPSNEASSGLLDLLAAGGNESLDLTIELPAGTVLEVRDSSGSMDIGRVGTTRVQDSSGAISIRDVEGHLRVEDSSGAIEIERVAGDLHIPHDSSGPIRIRDIEGDVRIDHDSSGEIHIAGVGGDVWIGHDSSGEIVIEDVKGGVRIDQDSSGGILVSRVGRDVEIGSDGSGEVRVSDVQGAFTIRQKGSGQISHDRIGGPVSIPSR